MTGNMRQEENYKIILLISNSFSLCSYIIIMMGRLWVDVSLSKTLNPELLRVAVSTAYESNM